ncbi:hypothetical protein THAOC_17569, partial [Thalassiosira oceanica]
LKSEQLIQHPCSLNGRGDRAMNSGSRQQQSSRNKGLGGGGEDEDDRGGARHQALADDAEQAPRRERAAQGGRRAAADAEDGEADQRLRAVPARQAVSGTLPLHGPRREQEGQVRERGERRRSRRSARISGGDGARCSLKISCCPLHADGSIGLVRVL